MHKSLLLIALFLLTLTVHAQTPRYAPAPSAILLDVVARNSLQGGDIPRYCCAWLDLNGDRTEEAILWSPAGRGAGFLDGGSRYSGFAVYQKSGSRYKLIGTGLYGRDFNQIGVLTTRTGKWLDLASYAFTFGDEKTVARDSYWFRCRYGAKGYSMPGRYEGKGNILKTAPKLLLNKPDAPTYTIDIP
jgi:hypothetical protein